MKKIDPVIVKETVFIAVFSFFLSAVMQSVFLIAGKWNYTVLTGNILGYCAIVANFLIMGLSVQKAVSKEEKEARNIMKLSQTLRMLLLFAVAIIGYCIDYFSVIAVVIPFLFPRFAIALRPLFTKK